MNKKLTNYFFIFSLFIFVFSIGFKLGEYKTKKSSNSNQNSYLITAEPKQKLKEIDLDLFWETWNKLEEKFIDKNKLNQEKMLYGAIKGMVASLGDPYTFFLTPDENKQSKNDLEGKFEGIGAQLGLKDNRVIVVAPLKDSPAEKAGVKAGDFIKKVNGEETKDWSLTYAVSKIRGPKGTKVVLTLQRDKKEFDVTIIRDEIKVKSVDLSYESKKDCKKNCPTVAYVKINQFGDKTNDEWDKAVFEIKNQWQKKQIKGLILDLRDNPGGYLESATYLASDFLPFGTMIVKQESTTGINQQYKVIRQPNLIGIPLVVLINKGSASASEILAGALRDHKKATLVGEKTFGKGSVQEALDLKGGAGLHVTVAKWILPNGDWINHKGIEPQIKIENIVKEGDTLTRENDKQLEKAIEILLK